MSSFALKKAQQDVERFIKQFMDREGNINYNDLYDSLSHHRADFQRNVKNTLEAFENDEDTDDEEYYNYNTRTVKTSNVGGRKTRKRKTRRRSSKSKSKSRRKSKKSNNSKR
jgi:hypothetical protein